MKHRSNDTRTFHQKPTNIFIVVGISFLLMAHPASHLLGSSSAVPVKTGTSEEIIEAIEKVAKSGKANDATVTDLITVLRREAADVRVRERAAWALGELRAKKAEPALIAACKSKGLLVRSASLSALIRLRSSNALPTFMEIALNDPILSLRKRATLALGLSRSERAIEAVVKLSSDEREEIRGASVLAMTALHSSKNNFTELLQEMKEDTSPYVQSRAELGLNMAKGNRVPVRTALHLDDPDVRLFSAHFLRYRGREGDLQPLRARAAKEPDREVREELQAALRAIQGRIEAQRAQREKELQEKKARELQQQQAAPSPAKKP